MSKIVEIFCPLPGPVSSNPSHSNRAKTCRSRRRALLISLAITCIAVAGCSKKPAPTVAEQPQNSSSGVSNALVPDENAGASRGTLQLPMSFGKRTGDLDDMVRQRSIRAFVIVNPIGFFYQAGRPEGIEYEALQEFEKFVNQKMKTGKLPVNVVFLPMRPDQLEAALEQGLGDLIAQGIVITPEREQRVAFSVPIQKDVTQVVVTGSAPANVSSFDDLAGKNIYVNPLLLTMTISRRSTRIGKAQANSRCLSRLPTPICPTMISSRW